MSKIQFLNLGQRWPEENVFRCRCAVYFPHHFLYLTATTCRTAHARQEQITAPAVRPDISSHPKASMYHHVKKLMFTVRVDEPDPRFGNMLLEQFGGANGEIAAAMQYSIQGLNCEDPDRKDLLMDIGTEELNHLEVVGTLARMHLKPTKFDRQAAEADPLIAIAGGGGVNLFNSQATHGLPII